MLFSAPDDVARTNAITFASELDERLGQVRAHEAVRARDQAGAARIGVAELSAQGGEVLFCPLGVGGRYAHRGDGEAD